MEEVGWCAKAAAYQKQQLAHPGKWPAAIKRETRCMAANHVLKHTRTSQLWLASFEL